VTAGVVALTVEESVGACERTLAFVAFLQSPDGFGRWLSLGTSGHDPLTTSIELLPQPVTVEYRHATKILVVGSSSIDTTKGNVVVLAASAKGVAVRHQSTASLTFERRGRAPSFGADLTRFRPEIEAAVRAFVDRSPELRGMLGSSPTK
jgi:hypothetical protein